MSETVNTTIAPAALPPMAKPHPNRKEIIEEIQNLMSVLQRLQSAVNRVSMPEGGYDCDPADEAMYMDGTLSYAYEHYALCDLAEAFSEGSPLSDAIKRDGYYEVKVIEGTIKTPSLEVPGTFPTK